MGKDYPAFSSVSLPPPLPSGDIRRGSVVVSFLYCFPMSIRNVNAGLFSKTNSIMRRKVIPGLLRGLTKDQGIHEFLHSFSNQKYPGNG